LSGSATHPAARSATGPAAGRRWLVGERYPLQPGAFLHLHVMLGPDAGTLVVGSGTAHAIAIRLAFLLGHQLAAVHLLGGADAPPHDESAAHCCDADHQATPAHDDERLGHDDLPLPRCRIEQRTILSIHGLFI
jgi:hypothetical protein